MSDVNGPTLTSDWKKKAPLKLPPIDVADRPEPIPWTDDRLLGMCHIEDWRHEQDFRFDIATGSQLPVLPPLESKWDIVRERMLSKPAEEEYTEEEILARTLADWLRSAHRKRRIEKEIEKMDFWLPRMSNETVPSKTKKLPLPPIRSGKGEDGSRCSSSSLHEEEEEEEFSSDEDLDGSFTLPRIKEVLRAEGIRTRTIEGQLEAIQSRSGGIGALGTEGVERFLTQGSTLPIHETLARAKSARRRKGKKRWKGNRPLFLKATKKKDDGDEERNTVTAKEELDGFLADIEQTRWICAQQLERSRMGMGIQPPRLVVLASNVRDYKVLGYSVRDDVTVVTVLYDYLKATLETLYSDIRNALELVKEDCRARSILWFCEGGPGYIYMMKTQLLTPQKLARRPDLALFWKDIGDLVSKLDPSNARIDFMGCNVAGNEQGKQLMEDLTTLISPNKSKFGNPMDDTKEGEETIKDYFQLNLYNTWKDTKPP